MNISLKAKKQILRSQLNNARSRNNERQLERALQRFFAKLNNQVQSNLREYWSDNLLQGQIDLITAPVIESQAEYYLILQKYDKREYELGLGEAERLVKLARGQMVEKSIKPRLLNIFDLFKPMSEAETDLLNRVFIASQSTLARVNDSIKSLLTEGYQTGKGINYVANLLTERFTQLKDWEAKRIARTEIHNSHNIGVMDKYQEYDVEYTMWISAHDKRVRGLKPTDKADHVVLDGEIIRLGDTYSNGLRYPGDTDGPLVEWINCRCSNAPFVMPYGFMAPPSMKQFRETDLIKIE